MASWHTPITGYTPGPTTAAQIAIQGIPGSSSGTKQGPGSWSLPGWASTVGTAGLSAGLGLASSAFQAGQIKSQQKYAYKLARRYRRSSTADMRAAGLNPILAANQFGFGGGPALGGGTPAAPDLTSGVRTGKEVSVARHQIANLDAQTDLYASEAARALSQKGLNEVQAELQGSLLTAARQMEQFDAENPKMAALARFLERSGLTGWAGVLGGTAAGAWLKGKSMDQAERRYQKRRRVGGRR